MKDFRLKAYCEQIGSLDQRTMDRCRAHWDSIAKPLGGLGLLEEAVIKIAGMTGDAQYRIDKRAVVVMCADNGVVAQGVTQTGQEVTAAVAKNLTYHTTSVCFMAEAAHAEVFPVDVGIAQDVSVPGLLNRKVGNGTGDITRGPAMTAEECLQAVAAGIETVGILKGQGVKIIATGEMGIGNTTTSSALAAFYLHKTAAEVTGKGAGLSNAGLERKIRAVEKALTVNKLTGAERMSIDPITALSRVGGFDIAGLAGVFLGAAAQRVPVIIDGVISAVAALTACKICPDAVNYMLASHLSKEPASQYLLEALGLSPSICAGLSLGEGTGAVAFLPLLDMAYTLYYRMGTFGDMEIEPYKRL